MGSCRNKKASTRLAFMLRLACRLRLASSCESNSCKAKTEQRERAGYEGTQVERIATRISISKGVTIAIRAANVLVCRSTCRHRAVIGIIKIPIVIVVIIIAIFFWAVKSDQFDDLEGPAYRILMDDDDKEKASKKDTPPSDGTPD